MRANLSCLIVLVSACGSSATAPPMPAPSTPEPATSAPATQALPPTTTPPSNSAADAARALRDKLVAIDAHVDVLKNVSTFAEYRDVLNTVERTEGVVAAEPFAYAEVLAASASHAPIAIRVKGVDPQRVGRVLDLSAHMTTGKIQDLANGNPPAIILGNELADTLRVRAGDLVALKSQVGTGIAAASQIDGPPREHQFRVAGILHIGFDVFDQEQAYASLTAVQKILNHGDDVMGIEVKVKAIDQSAMVARVIDHTLGGPPYVVIDWYERNHKLFTKLFGELRP